MVNVFGSMNLGQPTALLPPSEDARIKRERRRSSLLTQPLAPPEETLLSLSTNTSQIVAKLMEPGMWEGDTDTEIDRSSPKLNRRKIVQWEDTIPFKFEPKARGLARIIMPGTLIAPTPEASLAMIPDNLNQQRNAPEEPKSPLRFSSSAPSSSKISSASRRSPTQSASWVGPAILSTNSDISSTALSDECAIHESRTQVRPIRRSMSTQERDFFITNISNLSDATVYILPKVDIPTLVMEAANLGLYARWIMNQQDDADPNGFFVVGKNEEAVMKLFRQLVQKAQSVESPLKSISSGNSSSSLPIPSTPGPNSEATSKNTKGSSPSKSTIGMVAAGSVVMGVVGAWASLAFT